MGDPKKQRKKYSTPKKAWERKRIDEEKELVKEYYFKNKTEIWKLKSCLRNFARQAKQLIALKDAPQAQKEKAQLLKKIGSLGLIKENAILEDILGITLNDLLDRRLQSVVFKKGLAKTMKQARQFIVHSHVTIDNKKITSPNYLVPVSKETFIAFSKSSALTDEMHPERIQKKEMPKKPESKERKTDEKKEAPKESRMEQKKEAKKEHKKEAPKEKKEEKHQKKE